MSIKDSHTHPTKSMSVHRTTSHPHTTKLSHKSIQGKVIHTYTTNAHLYNYMILSCVTQHVCLYRMFDTGTTKCVCLACQIHNKLYLYNTQTTKCIYLQVKVMDIQTCIQDKVTHMHAQQNVCLYRTKSCTYRPVYRTKSRTCMPNKTYIAIGQSHAHVDMYTCTHTGQSHIHAQKMYLYKSHTTKCMCTQDTYICAHMLTTKCMYRMKSHTEQNTTKINTSHL